MPSLKIWGQDEGLSAAPSADTQARGWFRSAEEFARPTTVAAPKARPIRPGDELPQTPPASALSRRGFLQIVGGSLGVASLEGCFKPPNGQILPYGTLQPNVIPGEALHYATGLDFDGVVTPLLVTCYDGRPVKVEGNPEHPENLGSTGVFEQSILNQLYDPNRSQDVLERGEVRSEDSLRRELKAELHRLEAAKGEGLRLLVAPTTSPVVRQRRAKVLERFPRAKIIEYAPLDLGAGAATEHAFGQRLTPTYELSNADVVVSLDADFLWTLPWGQRPARDFAARRSSESGTPMNRLYAVETNLSITGMMADHRLRILSSEVGGIALELLRAVMAQRPLPGVTVPAAAIGPAHAKFVAAMAKDLLKNAGRSLVMVGPRQPAEVQAAAHLINLALGNTGTTVTYTAEEARPERVGLEHLRELIQEIGKKQVSTLLVMAPNPALHHHADLDVGTSLAAVPFSVYLAPYEDETAQKARWVLPAAHPFECWSDAIAADGSHLVLQPLLAPLFGGRSELELLGWLLEGWSVDAATPPHDLVYTTWHQHVAPQEAEFDGTWNALLRRGFTSAPNRETVTPSVGSGASEALGRAAVSTRGGVTSGDGLELNLYPSYQVHDGRFGRNGWLLEMPDPVTKLTWTNAALLSPKTAEKLGVQTGDVVELTIEGGQAVRLPAYILPGHADGAVSVALGYGQPSSLATVGEGGFDDKLAGVDAYRLRTTANPWFHPGVRVRVTGDHKPLSISQEHWTMDDREIAIEVKASALPAAGPVVPEKSPQTPDPSFYDSYKYDGFKWSMAIDLARCSGCSACVVACQAENNTPIVGEEQVRLGREMHWIRLDRYFTGESLEDPGAITQPVACVQCEDAPCEYVCPVNATVHSDEGLNEMVYNRCVGTRYCSNNCPYHVRRFNYLNYQYGNKTETEKMIFNPDVTVRSRGVMEKCTYCVQRIERGRIKARVEGRELKDGDIKTACQSACPTQAITFGTLSDPQSQVTLQRNDPRAYQLLKETGTRPRTVHLVRVKNPNPELG